jgi:predicted transglutaminase-like protease
MKEEELEEDLLEDENNNKVQIWTTDTQNTEVENETVLLKLDNNYMNFKIKEMKEVIKNYREEEMDLFNEREKMKQKIDELYD